MLWDSNTSPFSSIEQVKSTVSNRINIFAPHHASYFSISISHGKSLSLLRFLIFETQNIIGSSSFVGVSNKELILHGSNFLCLSILFLLHKLPSLEIPLVFLNPKNISHNIVTYLLESIFSCLSLVALALFSFSMAAKSRLNLSFSGKK